MPRGLFLWAVRGFQWACFRFMADGGWSKIGMLSSLNRCPPWIGIFSRYAIAFFDTFLVSVCFTMAESNAKKPKVERKRTRHTLQLEVDRESESRLDHLLSRIGRVKSSLCITSRTPKGNVRMMEKLLDAFEKCEERKTTSETPWFPETSAKAYGSKPSSCDVTTQTDLLPPYVLATGENTTGCFDIHTPSKPVEDYFISSNDALQRLVETMARYHGNCPLCGYSLDVRSFSVLQHGHTARISISCVAGHSLRWYSSSTVAGKFTANLRSCSYIVL